MKGVSLVKYNYSINQDKGRFVKIKLPLEILLVELVFDDMESFNRPIFFNSIQRVLDGKAEHEEVSGNMCNLDIHKDITIITAERVNSGMGYECQIETIEIKNLIELWVKVNNISINQ